jgi:hypothetical protein
MQKKQVRLTMSELPSIIQSLQELQRMHQLNLELLEHLGVFFQWILDSKIDISNKEKFESLLHKTKALMNELYCLDSPKTLHYSAIRRKVTDNKSDEEVPEPYDGFLTRA